MMLLRGEVDSRPYQYPQLEGLMLMDQQKSQSENTKAERVRHITRKAPTPLEKKKVWSVPEAFFALAQVDRYSG
jgi:hypothetical protein